MNRRQFIGGMGGLVATSALPGCKTVSEGRFFAGRGQFERLSISYAHIPIGLEKPFSILHISDTHLTAAYDDEPVAQCGKAAARTQTFGGRQECALASSLDWASRNVDYVLHTGDLIDFQSRANFDVVKKYLGEGIVGSMGNHEFYSYVKADKGKRPERSEEYKTPSWEMLKDAYPYDARFNATVVNGVNFICIDDVFGAVQPDQVEKFKAEAKKGLPMVLCMHVPIHTPLIRLVTWKSWKRNGRKFEALPKYEEKTGSDIWNQENDPTTRDFIAYLKGEKLLKAILSGHEHLTMQEEFSPTCTQYVVAGNFLFHGREVLFI